MQQIKVGNYDINIPLDVSRDELVRRRYQVMKEKEEDSFFFIENLKNNIGTEPDSYIDIGCNAGVFSVLARQVFHDISIYAFDPIPSNVATTLSMLRANEPSLVGPTTICQQAFLGSESSFVRLFDIETSAGNTSGTDKDRAFRIDDLSDFSFVVPIGVFAIPSGNNIWKIDVDGPEIDILKGFSEEQWGSVSAIEVEVDLYRPDEVLAIHEEIVKKGGVISKNTNIIVEQYMSKIEDHGISRKLKFFSDTLSAEDSINDGMWNYLNDVRYHHKRITRKINDDADVEKQRLAFNLFYYFRRG